VSCQTTRCKPDLLQAGEGGIWPLLELRHLPRARRESEQLVQSRVTFRWVRTALADPVLHSVHGSIMNVTEVPGAVPLYQIDGFLTPEECAALRRRADAVVDHADGSLAWHVCRNAAYDRVVMVDADLANELWERVRKVLPLKYGGYHLLYLNRFFRFSRYEEGGLFPLHLDGKNDDVHPSGVETSSYFTLNIFLNGEEEFKGGATDFFNKMHGHQLPRFQVAPKMGRAALFWAAQPHRGNRVTQGRKYLLRTDVMGILHPTKAQLQRISSGSAVPGAGREG